MTHWNHEDPLMAHGMGVSLTSDDLPLSKAHPKTEYELLQQQLDHQITLTQREYNKRLAAERECEDLRALLLLVGVIAATALAGMLLDLWP